MRHKASLLLLAGTLLVVEPVNVGAAPNGAPSCTSRWQAVTGPNPGGDSYLWQVAALTSSNAWAVGWTAADPSGTQTNTLVEHWNGRIWEVVSSPNVTGTDALFGIAALSQSDVWAVGDSVSSDQSSSRTLVEHWDGRAWSVVPSPNAGVFHELNHVAARSANDVWAVGWTANADFSEMGNLVEHWNGTAWTIVAAPGSTVGSYLTGVAPLSSTDVFIAGTTGPVTDQKVRTWRWDGAHWHLIAFPQVGGRYGTFEDDIAGVRPSDMWVVGGYRLDPTGNVANTLTAHWDGERWTAVPSPNPNPGGSQWLSGGLAAIASDDIWAAGSIALTRLRTFTMHWDGKTWSLERTPAVSLGDNFMAGIASLPSGESWATGYALDQNNSLSKPLILHRCDGGGA